MQKKCVQKSKFLTIVRQTKMSTVTTSFKCEYYDAVDTPHWFSVKRIGGHWMNLVRRVYKIYHACTRI